MIKKRKRPVGRPPAEGETMTQIAIRFSKPFLAAVDEIVQEREGETDRSSVIRELATAELRSRGKLPKR